MNDKFFIEDYREHKIWYNADTDKFTVELLVEHTWREKGRKSLKECRTAIDSHIKSNAEFKPFKAIRKNWRDGELINIKQVRADGGLVFASGRQKDQIEISEVIEQLKGNKINYFQYDVNYLQWKDEGNIIAQRQEKEMQEHKSKEPSLTPLDLSFVKQFMKP